MIKQQEGWIKELLEERVSDPYFERQVTKYRKCLMKLLEFSGRASLAALTNGNSSEVKEIREYLEDDLELALISFTLDFLHKTDHNYKEMGFNLNAISNGRLKRVQEFIDEEDH